VMVCSETSAVAGLGGTSCIAVQLTFYVGIQVTFSIGTDSGP
jgi:hypothetical protein